MKLKLAALILFILLLPNIYAKYFQVYQFTPDDCKEDPENTGYMLCRFQNLNKSSNLYYIETDEKLEDRVRSESFLYEIGTRIWPTKPTQGAFIFVGFIGTAVFLIFKYKEKLV